MEEWQKQYINKNLPELISLTKFNVKVKAKLQAANILSPTDVEELDAESDRKGKAAASYTYYHCLMTRVGAYKVLAKILQENKQTGAARILMNGVRKFNCEKIDVQGKLLKLHEFFDQDKLELVQQIFRDAITDLDMYDLFVKNDKTFLLATSSIPQQPPLYIPRFLSNRIEIGESIFKADCPDIFVFKETIPRYKLSEIAKPHSTDTSTSQLTNITLRFIHLDEIEDWDELKKSAKVPIHLINYEISQQIYLLEDTTAASEILSKVGSENQRVYLSEDEFVQQQLSGKVSSVCICDTPGMGKTYLLANIARSMSKRCTGTIVVFIQLSTFVADLLLSSTNSTNKQDAALLKVFKYVSSSREHADLLLTLVKANLLQVEIGFDGFDEISSDEVECMKQIFLSVKSKLQNVRIYITSRPHMRHELEKSLGVIAFDILPFNLQNQVDFLAQFWSPKVPELDQTLLATYAQTCLKEINQTLSRNEKEMAGIPLLCRLIAEVYANKVRFCLATETKNIVFPSKIAAMYQQFVELRIKACAQNEDEFKKIKLIHIWHALKLLFPTEGFHEDEMFTTFNQDVLSSEDLKAGILQLQSNTKLEFIHRTFAEYFAAEYFSGKLQSTAEEPNTNDGTNKMVVSILKLLLIVSKGHTFLWSSYDDYNFVHSVVLNFVDFSLNEHTISEKTTSQLASFCASISTQQFLHILCSCCRHNLHSIFNALTKAVSKWNQEHKNKYFTTENSFCLLNVCIRESTSQMFRSCTQLLTEELQLELEKICIFDRENTLLDRAAFAANYEAVEYLLNRVSFELPNVLKKCVYDSCYEGLDKIKRRENILHLLLNKNPNLIQETPDVLDTDGINLVLFKMLVNIGANLTAVRYMYFARKSIYVNCAMRAAKYMSSSDFHELVQFFLNECKAEYLFLDHEKWRDPMPFITERGKLLPETLELLLNIPGVDINMKDKYGTNLLFSAVRGNNVNNFQLLLNRGLNFKAIGKENRSLLHEATIEGKLEMIRYLLSLGMDPNPRDKREETPLHYVAKHNKLSVVEVLMENGANVHAKNINGRTSLHLASKVYDKCSELIVYLIRKGAEVNDRDNDGNTPLHLCSNRENKDCLLEMGADIHAKNKKGETPAQKNWWRWK